ncbi:MAG TPA: hypothetical protein VIV66_01350 [Pyrinomonadaceae bacterium]
MPTKVYNRVKPIRFPIGAKMENDQGQITNGKFVFPLMKGVWAKRTPYWFKD